jgi:hypothetical protein
MLKHRQRDDAFDTELSVAEEERVRADERRRVLAELADDQQASTDHQRDQDHDGDVDWRSAPPPFGEERVAGPDDAVPTAPTGDPRRWDVPDDRWTSEHRDDRMAGDTAEVAAVRGDETPAAAPVVVEDTVVERGQSPGQLLIALAGACALALGIVAVVRTGLERPLAQPVEPVLGWDHTATLGLLEIGAGALMLLASLRAGLRWLGALCGAALIAGGIFIVADVGDRVEGWIADNLAAERGFGWIAIAIGAVAIVGALIPRRRHTRRTTHARYLS